MLLSTCTLHCFSIDYVNWFIRRLTTVPAVLNEAVPATMRNIEIELEQTLQTVNKYIGKYKVNVLISFAYTRDALSTGRLMTKLTFIFLSMLDCVDCTFFRNVFTQNASFQQVVHC